MKFNLVGTFLLLSLASSVVNASSVTDELIKTYSQSASQAFSSQRGKALWHKAGLNKQGLQRGCTTCHGENLKAKGKHYRSGKTIQAMAPSVNSTRFNKLKKVKKWLKRNCKWTFGKECTAQQKGDLLTYLSQL